MKVYLKRGNTNYKEKKLVAQLEAAIDKKIEANPEFANSFKPANSFEELQALCREHCIDDVEFTETKGTDTNTTTTPEETPLADQHTEFRNASADAMPKQEIRDPFNRANPIVRDYVLEPEFAEDTTQQQTVNTNFEEPTTFSGAFDMPTDGPQTGKEGDKKQTGQQKAKIPPQAPFNPAFETMADAKKKKSTKRFAKYITEAVCMLAEYGYVYFATKDINEIKLAQYELNNEIDLDVLITLTTGQEATIKQFFAAQCLTAKTDSKIPQEEKNDLADALADVLMEKGIAPTATQELIMIAGKIFGGQAIKCVMQKSQTDSILQQLKDMKNENTESEDVTNSMQDAEDAAVKAEQTKTTQQTHTTTEHEDESAENVGNPAVEETVTPLVKEDEE